MLQYLFVVLMKFLQTKFNIVYKYIRFYILKGGLKNSQMEGNSIIYKYRVSFVRNSIHLTIILFIICKFLLIQSFQW